jgi:hypothetical protein
MFKRFLSRKRVGQKLIMRAAQGEAAGALPVTASSDLLSLVCLNVVANHLEMPPVLAPRQPCKGHRQAQYQRRDQEKENYESVYLNQSDPEVLPNVSLGILLDETSAKSKRKNPQADQGACGNDGSTESSHG